MKITTALLPRATIDLDLTGKVCIILDVFRATTCIVTAMSHGCKSIIPVIDVASAQAVRQQSLADLLAGERSSLKIAGFDLGNSPFDFYREMVLNKRIAMTTTNGTIAINAAKKAHAVLIGAFNNAAAISRRALRYKTDIVIICAGTNGDFSLEDSFCAGLIIENLCRKNNNGILLDDSSLGAKAMYAAAKDDLIAQASVSTNGQRLVKLDKMDEIEYCLRRNIIDAVPIYQDGRIILNNHI